MIKIFKQDGSNKSATELFAVMATTDEGETSLFSIHSSYEKSLDAIESYYNIDKNLRMNHGEDCGECWHEYEVQSAILDQIV